MSSRMNRIGYYGSDFHSPLLSMDECEYLKKVIPISCSVTLSERQLCDLEMLMSGALNPLDGFMTESEYESVVTSMQLSNGLLWSMPITLDVTKEQIDAFNGATQIGLCDKEGFMLAVMDVESVWKPDKNREATEVYQLTDIEHPSIRYLMNTVKEYYIGGHIKGMQLPIHFDFGSIRNTPSELREEFNRSGWENVVCFHTSKPMHRLHQAITTQAAKDLGANLLIHPVSGVGKPGELAYYSRVHCYQAVMKYYPGYLAKLSLVPQAMRMAGPREAIHNMIVRQNYGCTHFIVGPDHASPPATGSDSKKMYESCSAQKFVEEHQSQLQIQMYPVEEKVYSLKYNKYISHEPAGQDLNDVQFYNENDFNTALEHDGTVPVWYSYPEVISELGKVILSRKNKGLTLFFTGLSGSGKSTLAKLVYARFIEQGDRPVTLLDGDVVRINLSNELGFSKEHRDLNVQRIGYVASEITKNRGVAICAPIAPYESVRATVRTMIEGYGAFIEIHVSTPLDMCESRDRKGMYAKARKGIIKNFTGISDPYEIPVNPEIRIDTSALGPVECAQKILIYLFKEGYIN